MKKLTFAKINRPNSSQVMGYICRENLDIYITVESGHFLLYHNQELHSGWPTLKAAREVAAQLN